MWKDRSAISRWIVSDFIGSYLWTKEAGLLYDGDSDGFITATRVIMGSTDAEQVMKPFLGSGVQVWLDDVLGYSDTDSNCWIR